FGGNSKRIPELETDNLSEAKKWRRESLTRLGYDVKFKYKGNDYYSSAYSINWSINWREWRRVNFERAVRTLDNEQYLWEKWKGSHSLRHIKVVIGKHLMRVCRSQAESCAFRALLPEVDIGEEK
ncbi:unnamed protein product, partial [marine sediment metagenome]